jgi:hypothetical protein
LVKVAEGTRFISLANIVGATPAAIKILPRSNPFDSAAVNIELIYLIGRVGISISITACKYLFLKILRGKQQLLYD